MESRRTSPASSSREAGAPGGDTSSSPASMSDSFGGGLSQNADAGDVHNRVESEETERHPKGRRKRTAAKDKAILEAAYNSNPKPDKAARLEIVRRVSLNEKEVQIWFQNRRQNDRRKSRPLSPQEVAALRYGGMQILSSKPVTFLEPKQDSASSHHHHDASGTGPVAAEATITTTTTPIASPDLGPWIPGRYPRMDTLLNPSPPPPKRSDSRGSSAYPYGATDFEASGLGSAAERRPLEEDVHSGRSQAFSFSFSGSVATNNSSSGGHGAWAAGPRSSFSTPSSSQHRAGEPFRAEASELLEPSSATSTASAPILPPPLPRSKSGSQVRLSLSLEGKASVVSLFGSPSPPRAHQTSIDLVEPIPIAIPAIRSSSLHRRGGTVTLPPISSLTGSLAGSATGNVVTDQVAPLPRLSRGRSRDTLAWEFACDNAAESREDELSTQAEREAEGSAVAAISILRTASASSCASSPSSSPFSAASPGVLQPNGSKRNAPMSRQQNPHGSAAAPLHKRAKLGRATSSVARLQTPVLAASASRLNVERLVDPIKRGEYGGVAASRNSRKKIEIAALVTSGGGDSDKENWSPDEDGNPMQALHGRRHEQSHRRPHPSVVAAPAATSVLPHPLQPSARSGLFTRSNTAPVSSLRSGSRGENMGGGGFGVDIFEDDERAGADENGPSVGKGDVVEVERFMRGEVSPSKKSDMDCIVGLLSLSQGAWQ